MQRFVISGMTCGHCVRAITEAVREVDPEAAVRVDLAGGAAEVDSVAPAAALLEAIGEAGYPARSAAG